MSKIGRPKKKKKELKTPWAGRFDKRQRDILKTIDKKSIQAAINKLIDKHEQEGEE